MSSVNSSKIFLQTRALGYVTNDVPHVSRYIKKRRENLIITCVGKSFHTYGCDKFSLLSVSPQHPGTINCLAADTFLVFTASDNVIFAWRRGTELKHIYRGHTKPVHHLLPFGPHIISVDDDSTLNVWNIKTEEVYLELNFDNQVFRITALCHPYVYINKILLGSEQGEMQLWNINRSKLIFSFVGWFCPITVLEPAPAVDIVAVGLRDGKIVLHNLRHDNTIHIYEQGWGSVTSISFLTDGQPIMVSGSTTGNIIIWNLNDRRIVSQLLNAHSEKVTGLTCLPKEPLMVTSSPDNSLKLWIFDMTDGGARLLRIREGHSSPPIFIRFYDLLGCTLLSAGNDSSLRIFNLVTEIANKSLGRASYNRHLSKKRGKNSKYLIMSPIVRFATGIPNNIEFDDIAAVHCNDALVSTWSFHYARMSEVHVVHNRFKHPNKQLSKTKACSVCFSSCMNFLIIGYTSGHVDKFNIQSGIWRGSYGESVAHSGHVRGVATDNINKIVITGGSDQCLKFWLFQICGKPCFSCLNLDDSVSFFSSHQESSLLAVALEDFSVHLVDIDFRVIVRKFNGHTGPLNDITFSPDLRWLISAAMDTTIQIWDIPSGQLIDYIVVDAPCISLSFSPTGEYLATVHVDHFGVYLWANKTLFTHVSLRPLNDIQITAAPVSLCTFNEIEEIENATVDDNTEFHTNNSKEQICDLITLSQMTSSRWQNILDIDIIKKRNKPREPPKKPEAAPFFLPTIPSLNLEFDFSNIKEKEDINQNRSKNNMQNYTVFCRLLDNTISTNDFISVIDKIRTLSPSAIYLEVTSLSFNEEKSIKLLLQFMKMLEKMLIGKKDFELAQSYLGIFLKVHDAIIINSVELTSYLKRLQYLQEKTWKNLEDKLLYCLSVVSYMRNI